MPVAGALFGLGLFVAAAPIIVIRARVYLSDAGRASFTPYDALLSSMTGGDMLRHSATPSDAARSGLTPGDAGQGSAALSDE